MSQSSVHTACFDSSRVLNPEKHQAFIEENTCPFCNKLARDICQCQLGCGGLFGYGCFSNPDVNSCPKCKKPLEMEKHQYKNRYINKLVSSQVQLKCVNHNNGCGAILNFDHESVMRHETSCNYFTAFCSKKSQGCEWEGGNENLQNHMMDCEFCEFVCEFCRSQVEDDFEFLKKEKESHESQCLNQISNQVLEKLQNQSSLNAELKQQIVDLISAQQQKIKSQNKKVNEIIKYAVSLEKTEEKKRDKSVILNDFKKGILSFNSLENLQDSLNLIDPEYIKSIKLNDTNLNSYTYGFKSLNKDFTSAIQKIEKLAENGDKHSQYSLARLYYWGDKNINQDISKSLNWVKKAIEQQSPEAYWLMGDLYYDNKAKGFVPQSYETAFKYYQQAASMGNAEALNSLGQMYDDGEGTEANEKKAVECFEKSAALGDYGGLYNLAVYHQEGYGGLAKNHEKAFQLYLQSAKKGDNDAMKRVAIFLKQGKGVDKNLQLSNKWAKKAGLFKNKQDELFSQSTMASYSSMTSIQCISEDHIKSDVI